MKIFFRATCACLLLVSLAPASHAGSVTVTDPREVGMSAETLALLRQRLARLIEERQTGGIQVLVARRGKVVMHENFGMADAEAGVPLTGESLFRIFSMTKPVTGVALMMLYEEGRFSLGDPIAKYIPEFENLRVFAGIGDDGEMILEDAIHPPTMHELLQHNAGFTYGWFGDTPVDRLYNEANVFDPDSTLQEMIDKLAGFPLLYQPGTRFHYSLSTEIQGYIVEKLSGMDLESYMRTRIFEPLDMDETTGWLDADERQLLAKIHTHNEAGELVVDHGYWSSDFHSPPGLFMGGAQLVSTTDDYWRFAQMLLNGGTLNGERLLSRLTVEMMTTNRLPESVVGRRTSPGLGFGLDFGVVTDATLHTIPVSNGEYFWGGAATTLFWIDPEEELIGILFSQYVPFDAPRYDDLMHRMLRAAIVD